jgi:hypothetical protein
MFLVEFVLELVLGELTKISLFHFSHVLKLLIMVDYVMLCSQGDVGCEMW